MERETRLYGLARCRSSAWITWMSVSALAMSSCGAGDDLSPNGARHVIGDTTFVFSDAPARDTAELREIMRIGRLDGPDEYLFAGISMFAVGPRGEVYVAEFDGSLRQFDAEGDYVRTIARTGQGPGEVEYVVGMDVAPDGRLAIVDFGNQRISIYSPEGEFLEQRRRPAGRPRYGRDAIRWGEDGALWIGLHPPRSGPDTLGAGPRPLFGRLIDEGEVVDTVFLPRRAWEGCERRSPAHAGGFFEDSRIPFLPFAHWARAASGALVFGCSARYGLDVVDDEGSVLRVSRTWRAAVMSDDEYGFWSTYEGEVSRERPAYLRIWLADDGRIWTRPGRPGTSWETTPEQRERGFAPVAWYFASAVDGLDVFSADGAWIGHVRTPESWAAGPYPGNRDPFFRGDTVWAVTRDELDAEYVSRFVVEWPSAH